MESLLPFLSSHYLLWAACILGAGLAALFLVAYYVISRELAKAPPKVRRRQARDA